MNKLFYFDTKDILTPYKFGNALYTLIKELIDRSQEIIFLCIGSDRATGDCLGPILGYKLSGLSGNNCIIYGTLESPVHAGNLELVLREIKLKYNRPFIIAIDASLGKASHIGYITLGKGTLKPGAGVDKELPSVGDIFITGIVNLSGVLDHMLLQTTRLHVVMSLADKMYSGIDFCMKKLLHQTMDYPVLTQQLYISKNNSIKL